MLDGAKIVFVHGSLGLGGAEVLRLSILEEMVKRDANVEVVVLRKRGELADRVEELGVPLTVLNNRGGLFDVQGVRKFAKWLRGNKPDIVQSSQFLTNLHTSLACRFSKTRNHIIEEHGIYTWKKAHHKWIDRNINSRAVGIVACSHEVARSAANDLKVPLERITVIHNCVSQNHLDGPQLNAPGREEKRRSLTGHDSPGRLAGIVGTLRWEKGHGTLFDAWEALGKSGAIAENDFLIVVGDGPLRGELESRAKELKGVRFTGSVSNTKPILESLDLFVLPSHNEGFGIAIIEAMAAGVPVVATQSGGIPEIIHSDTVGRLVPVGDHQKLANAIANVFSTPELADSLGTNGKIEVESRFSPRIYVDQLANLWAKTHLKR